MSPVLPHALAFFGAALLVDFLSGVFHWLEDSYGSERTPFLGRHVTRPNVLHHHDPRAFTRSPFLRRNAVTWLIVALVMTPLLLWTHGNVFVAWITVFGALSNEIHCWAHRSAAENGPLITALQRCRLLQTPAHHALHHTDPKRDAYCVVTNLLNPVLDRLRFFRALEWVGWRTLGRRPRVDPSVAAMPAAPGAVRPA